VDLLGATINAGAVPDGHFFAWLGQFQWVRRLWDTDSQLILRSDLQVAADPLLPLEKLAIGGAATVRGYRENVFVRDNGWVSSLEFRIPIFRLPLPWISQGAQDGWVQLAPFFDAGWSTNTDDDTPSPKTIYSAGLGLRWDPSPWVHSELYWGYPFKEVEDPIAEHDLQDDGIHFALNAQIF
jgi:hemolysin activation/secretion protein